MIDGIARQPVFDKPPVSGADLKALRQTFDDAVILAKQGGAMNTAAKNGARTAMVNALRKDALYVEITADNDLPLLLSSGYRTASTNRAQNILGQVELLNVAPGQSGELKVRVRPIPNAKSYEGRIKPANGSEFGTSISFASTRKILFEGLTAGVNYTLQLCAIGGSTGRGDWSAPSSHMAM